MQNGDTGYNDVDRESQVQQWIMSNAYNTQEINGTNLTEHRDQG